MRIKKFEAFSESISESSRYYSRGRSSEYAPSDKGKTKFSRWMRGMSSGLRSDTEYRKGDSYQNSGEDPVNIAKNVFSLFGRLIFSAGAAVADFFSTGDNKDTFAKMSKDRVEQKKDDVLDSWEAKNIKGKNVTQKDAQDFYTSGVLKGKGYFGKGYDPENPKNGDERVYSDYLSGAMERYYDRLRPYEK